MLLIIDRLCHSNAASLSHSNAASLTRRDAESRRHELENARAEDEEWFTARDAADMEKVRDYPRQTERCY